MDVPTTPAKRSRAHRVGPRHSPHFVGRGAQRHPGRASHHQVHRFCAIPGRVHPGQVRLHPLRHPDGAGAAQLDLRLGGQLHIRPQARRQHHHFTGNILHPVRFNRADAALRAQFDVEPLQVLPNQLCQPGILAA